MNIRRRLALFLDPSLAYDSPPLSGLALFQYDRATASAVNRVADAVEKIERNTRRRPRIIECQHPELHGVDMAALGYPTVTDC